MSVEGVSADFIENSGEIKVRISDSGMTIDNSDSVNDSLIIMGHPTEELVSDEGSVNVLYKQILTSIDESAVVFNDLKSVEEWLRNRTETVLPSIDFDRSEDMINFNAAAAINNSENDGFILPQITHDTVIDEPNINGIIWEDLSLEPDSYINTPSTTSSKNFLFVPGVADNSENEPLEIHRIEGFLNLPNITVLSSPTKAGSISNDSYVPDSNIQIGKITSVEVNKNVDSSLITQHIRKKLPFVKIPKNCLMKGKILGKSNLSLISGHNPVSILKSPLKINNLNLATPNTHCPKKPLVLKGKKRTVFAKHHTNVNRRQAIMVLPVKHHGKLLMNSLSKISHSSNNIEDTVDATMRTIPEESSISVTHNSPRKGLPKAVVAISTDKSDDTTEIIIKTEEGENFFKGKTSDIMKATSSANDQNLDASQSVQHCDESENKTINALLVTLLGVSAEVLDNLEGTSFLSPLQCPVDGCNFSTSKGYALKLHILQHYGIRPFKCDFPGCSWSFYTSFRLKRHQDVHLKRKGFHCPVEGCDRSFSTIYNVNSHLKLHNRPTTEVCTAKNCNRAFQTRKSFEKHLREHGIDYAPYTCDKEGCGKKYFTINSLNSHSRIHQHKEEELKCPFCSKVFDQPCRLKAHINTHIGVKPYKCEDCMWAFTTSSKLRRHQRKHTQTRKHPCETCGKSFLRSEHLRDHSLKHFVKKSFVCPIADCGTVFCNKSTMYVHLKKHRNQEVKASEHVSYPCPMDDCDIVFNTKKNLRTHLQITHFSTALTNENSEDAIQLLSDENLITFESLQSNTNSGSGMVSFNAMSQEGLLVGMSDLVQCIPAMEQGEYSESNSSNNVVTHVVFTDDLTEECKAVEESPVLVELEDGIGSARTGLTYQEAKESKRRVSESLSESLPGLHMASDVVLSAGLLNHNDNLERLLQDDLSGGDLYNSMGGPSQEEVGLLGAAGEMQVLMLDPTTRLQHSDFEQSTINLRDLE